MSYNSSNGIITAPVSIQDVCNALNVSYSSSYADVGFLATRTSRINPTARYKPFKGGGVGVQTNLWKGIGTSMGAGWADGDEFNIDGNNRLSARANAAFGTLVPNLTFDSNGFPNSGNKWSCNTPTGGSNEPFRLSDFNGYISIPANCWDITIESAPHFAMFRKSQTDANANYRILFKPFKDDGNGNINKYYVTLRDIALTSLYNIDNLYLWIAIIAESTNTASNYKRIYAKRSDNNLRTIFGSTGILPTQVLFDFNLKSNFKPITGGTNINPTFAGYVDTSGAYAGMCDINGQFKIQCFIGPRINQHGICSSIYNVTINNVVFNSTYGSTALENQETSLLSLACMSTGSDVKTIDYKVVNWNTQLTQMWCNYSKSQITFSSTDITITSTSTPIKGVGTYNSSSNKTIFDITSSLYVLFKRGNVSGDYVDTVQTTVYFKISISYLVNSSYTFTLGNETTTHRSTENNPYTETSSYSSSIPLNGTSADNNPPHNVAVKDITVNGRVSSVSFIVRVSKSGSTNGTYTNVLEQMFTCLV